MKKTVIHKADTRGYAKYEWLEARYSFSFGEYYNPERVHFGTLRVLNDDIIDEERGFGTHLHENMEIITIPLEGELEHKDSTGNSEVIKPGEVQVMSAGTGIYHSEFNNRADSKVKLLQIWVFPNQKNVKPRYGNVKLNLEDRYNKLQQVVSPYNYDAGAWIYQNAWFYLGRFSNNFQTSYTLNDNTNGVYVFVIYGSVSVNGELLEQRDGMGITDIEELEIASQTDNAELLIMEIPMNVSFKKVAGVQG